jgi:uncharacterized protein (TIGR04222 family)
MYGPEFLIIYSFFILFTILAYSFLKNKLDETERFPMPPVSAAPDPLEIAYLRGGTNELARAAVFSLTRKNLLKISTQDKTSHIYPTDAQIERKTLSPLEQTALGWFGTTRTVKEIFQKDGLPETLKPHTEMYQARLELQHLLHSRDIIKKNNWLALKTFMIFAGLGLYKISVALATGFTNVFGIIFLTLVAALLLAWVKKMPRLTALGKAYLERLQLAFEKLKAANQMLKLNEASYAPAASTVSSVDPLMLSMGVFGATVLAGTPYNDFNEAFQKAQNQAGVNTSSCGSGCGSSSCSSGGGGADGGADGGGCGGCGGGCS